MKRRVRRPEGRFVIVIITIFAIAGTLSSCGRYGSPVRTAPAVEMKDMTVRTDETDTTAPPAEEAEEEAPSAEKNVADESSEVFDGPNRFRRSKTD